MDGGGGSSKRGGAETLPEEIGGPHGADRPGVLRDVTGRLARWFEAQTAFPCSFSMRAPGHGKAKPGQGQAGLEWHE